MQGAVSPLTGVWGCAPATLHPPSRRRRRGHRKLDKTLVSVGYRCNVESDRIDASIGLAFSLVLFERYRRNGVVQAELHHVPGMRGQCRGYLHLIEGKAVSCTIEDRQGQRHQVSKETLIQLDNDRGPFEWVLMPTPAPPISTPPEFAKYSAQYAPIPRRIGAFPQDKLEGWTNRQKMMLSIVFDVIDGQRSIEDIKADTPLPAHLVEEALRILLALKVVSIV